MMQGNPDGGFTYFLLTISVFPDRHAHYLHVLLAGQQVSLILIHFYLKVLQIYNISYHFAYGGLNSINKEIKQKTWVDVQIQSDILK